MRILLLKASEERKDYFELIGTEVTFSRDIISIGGSILHEKGEKAFISEVEYTNGYWSILCQGMYVKPKISTFKINGVASTCYKSDTFMEYKIK